MMHTNIILRIFYIYIVKFFQSLLGLQVLSLLELQEAMKSATISSRAQKSSICKPTLALFKLHANRNDQYR